MSTEADTKNSTEAGNRGSARGSVRGSARGNKGKRRRTRQLAASAYVLFRKGRRYLPPVLRGVLGLILIFLGLLGFLPILGFWMIPLGLALLATDIPPLGRWLRRRIQQARRDNS